MSKQIRAYTDGAALGNTKAERGGGWAYKLIYGEHYKTASGGQFGATNNQMEMTAVLMAMRSIWNKEIPVRIYSDSELVVNILSGFWLPKKNLGLWEELFKEKERFRSIKFRWTKGHNGNRHNEEVDRLAKEAAKRVDQREEQRDGGDAEREHK